MMRFALSSILLVAGSVMLEKASAAELTGIDVLTAKDSPLAEGEVIAFFGDSITQGGARPGGYCRLIGEAIEKQRPELGVRIVYAGISGHKVPNLQARLDRDVVSKKPTLVFIYIGINFLFGNLSLDLLFSSKFLYGTSDTTASDHSIELIL